MGALFAAVLVTGALLAGCGGDDDSADSAAGDANAGGSTNGSAESTQGNGGQGGGGQQDGGGSGGDAANGAKAEFVEAANGICQESVQEVTSNAFPILRKAAGKSLKAREAAEVRLASSILIPALQSEVDRIRELDVPEGDEEQVEAILDAIQEIVDKGEANPASLAQGNEPEPYADAAKLAEGYGIGSCPFG